MGQVLRDVLRNCANRRNPGGAMSHDGSFDLLDAGREFCVGWRMHHTCALSNNDLNPGGLRKPQTSAQLFGIDPGCRARRRWQCAVCESFVGSTDVVSVAASPRCTIEITGNHVNLLTNHDGTDCEDELFGNTPFFWRRCCLYVETTL